MSRPTTLRRLISPYLKEGVLRRYLISDLLEIVQKMSDDGMKYVYLDIQREDTYKKCYVEAIANQKSDTSVDYGSLDSVDGLED